MFLNSVGSELRQPGNGPNASHRKSNMKSGKVAIFLSGRGSNFASIARASRAKGANFSVRLVISDRKDAPGLKKAARFGIPAHHVDPKRFASKADYENEICALLDREGIDLICLAGYMRLIGPVLLGKYPGRILNIHPALLPSFPGLDAQAQALRHGVKVSGCTVHFVDAGTDTGPIIAQAPVPVRPGDDEETLKRRILRQEHRLYPRVISRFFAGGLQIKGRTVIMAEK
jgi:phosphoribosylglycinamide formyltransferase 1